jgi:mono/diheme cytochrome c family protein
MLRRWLVPAAVSALVGGVSAQGTLPELVRKYCADCHTGSEPDGAFDVEPLFAGEPSVASGRLGTVLQRLRSRVMPPVDEPTPSDAERDALLAAFEARLLPEAEAQQVTLRRLSRTEYARTVRAVAGVELPVHELLPEDPRTYGFDNGGDGLGMSPVLFEQYLDLADRIADAVLADPNATARVFVDGTPLATTLPPFLARAFRRPAEPAEILERQVLWHQIWGSVGAPDPRAAVLRSVFASPAFLYRVERGEPAAPAQLTQHELAVRLAYFATAAPPDDVLRARADRGELGTADAITAELQRLVDADAGRSLAADFAVQWLRFRDVLTANADIRRYPQIWQGDLRPALLEEAIAFVQGLIRDDGRVLELVDADHTWLNETLSKHYGFGEVQGATFVKVRVPDRRRGGVLGLGAVLMVTSQPLRTSPVQRGRWILDQLLGTPPPPPPPNVGTLPADDTPADGRSLRAQLEQHRRDRRCASCHAQMDPLGFALENFDVVGRWRTELHGQPIDAVGELPDGTRCDGPIGLKDALLARAEDVRRSLLRALLTYALGRPMGPADEAEIRRLAAVVRAGDDRFPVVLAAVVTSPLFTRRWPGGSR